MENYVSWFEIPAADFSRAISFYKKVLGINMEETEMFGTRMGFFPTDGRNVSGAIAHGEGYEPGPQGTRIYLNGGNDLTVPLSRVEDAGGRIIVPKTQISPEAGYFALFSDTEGNQVCFHSLK